MNKKGFTLIELLATIIILGIVMVITIPNLTETFNKSKLKSEEAFTKNLSKIIESYVSLNSDKISFTKFSTTAKKSGENETVTVYKSNNITFNTIIQNGIMNESDFINAGNKETTAGNSKATCIKTAEIEVYRDSDYVYCHKVKANNLGCLSDSYKKKLESEQFPGGKKATDIVYAIDTCVWK